MTEGKWKLIETAPRDGTRIIVANGREFACAEWTNGRFVQSPIAWEGSDDRGGLADLDFDPTHWMIPDLP